MRMQRSVHRAHGRHTARLTIAALLLSLLSVFGAPSPASADHPSMWEWDCVEWTGTSFYYTNQDGGYWYTNGRTIDGNTSDCQDINVTHNPNNPSGAFTVRVRFYPSNCGVGCNYANSWKTACSICWALAATNVANGTHYRLEFATNWESTIVYD